MKYKPEKIRCYTQDDELFLRYYSVDASSYECRPEIIVFPENEKDVIQIIKFANKNCISVTPRGAGTGLVGGALGRHIIVDFKNMNRIKISKDFIVVEPGVIKGILDEQLSKKNKFFSPNPSVGRYCTVGGMIGTNASGSHALKYGSIIDNLLEVTIIDGAGKKRKLPRNDKINEQILKIAKDIDSEKFPNVSKNSCGYRLDSVKNTGYTHKVIAGSEGTLGLVVSAKFKTRKIPKNKVLCIVSYTSKKHIQGDIIEISKLGPAAIEYLDKHTIHNIEYEFPKNTMSALFVEFDEHTRTIPDKVKKAIRGNLVLKTTKQEQIATGH